jgi:hypothetical protein
MLLNSISVETGDIEEDLYRIGVSMLEIFCSKEALSVAKFLSRESHKYPEFRDCIASFSSRDINDVLEGVFERHRDSLIDLGAPALARRFLGLITGDLSIIIIYDRDIPDAGERETHAREVSRLLVHGILKSPSRFRRKNLNRRRA